MGYVVPIIEQLTAPGRRRARFPQCFSSPLGLYRNVVRGGASPAWLHLIAEAATQDGALDAAQRQRPDLITASIRLVDDR